MKTYKYKIVALLMLLAFSVQAQKFDKKITDKFKVNSDAVIVINAVHTDVDIETWNVAHVKARRDQPWEAVWDDLHAARRGLEQSQPAIR